MLSELRGAAPTLLVMTHRLRAAQSADRIVVLDEGGVVEMGTHEVLLAAGGLYARLWRTQRPRGRDRACLIPSSRPSTTTSSAGRSTGGWPPGCGQRRGPPPAGGASVALFPLVTLVELAQPYLIKVAIDDHILKADWAGLTVVGCSTRSASARSTVADGRGLSDGTHRPAGDPRPARRSLQAPADAGSRLLRSHPGRAPDDPCPQRRGGGERGVHQRDLRDRGRRGHAARGGGHHAVDGLASGAGHLRHRAGALRRGRLFAHPRARRLSRGTTTAGPAQRLPAGIHPGHGGDPALRPRGARAPPVPAPQPGLSPVPVHLHDLRGLALRHGEALGFAGAGAAARTGRRHPGRGPDLRRAGRIHPVHQPLCRSGTSAPSTR